VNDLDALAVHLGLDNDARRRAYLVNLAAQILSAGENVDTGHVPVEARGETPPEAAVEGPPAQAWETPGTAFGPSTRAPAGPNR
jgi:plasmid stabilization system protein ParE